MRQRAMAGAILIFVSAITSVAGNADTIRVPLDQPSIKEGMSAASEGDTVLVAPGTYTGENNRDLYFNGINLVVISEEGAANTIIDCEGLGVSFRVQNGEDSTSVINGFTVTNGSGGNGGGIRVSYAAATIEHCILTNNSVSMNGGGIYYGHAPSAGFIRYCVFYGNSSPYRGGGISCNDGNTPYVAPVISNCVFYDNDAGSGGTHGGGGVFCNSSPATIISCTFVGNSGAPGAGGIHSYSSAVTARRCIIAFSPDGAGVYSVDADRCVIFGNAGEDIIIDPTSENLFIDPLLCDIETWNLMLCSNSPCLPGSPENPWGELIGAYESGCDECEPSVQKSSWGTIKAKFGDQ